MNIDELLHIEEVLRSFLAREGLAWILGDVDEAIASGVPEEKILRRRRGRFAGGIDSPESDALKFEVVSRSEISVSEFEASRKSGTLVIATRQMSDRERVELLLRAFGRVFVELPQVQQQVMKNFSEIPEDEEGTRPHAGGVTFISEQTLGSQPVELSLSSEVPGHAISRIGELLAMIGSDIGR